ncbi:MAG: PEP-CTERM sorting domain-containing protein [Phycisphaerae bacterium]
MNQKQREAWIRGRVLIMAVLAAAAFGGGALASPDIDSAIVHERIWNDAPYSTFTFGNLYPSLLWMRDEGLDQTGWANRHNFRLSENGGISDAVFMNDDAFEFHADVTITGTADSEGGLNLSPWWSQQVDGVFMVRTSDGEVSCWGGRLPFYNFSAAQGLTYTKGTTVRLGMVYDPHSLTEGDPGTIQYFYTDVDSTTYSSPVLAFDQGNPDEDPPYGLWGILNDARVGGYFMPLVNNQIPGNWGQMDFQNMDYVPEPASLALLGLASLALLRRRQ